VVFPVQLLAAPPAFPVQLPVFLARLQARPVFLVQLPAACPAHPVVHLQLQARLVFLVQLLAAHR
jgi:hypothetical protein